MTSFPDVPLGPADAWFTHQLIGAPQIQANIIDPINELAASSRGFIAEGNESASITLAVVNTVYVGGGATLLTWTVPPGGRSYRFLVKANFSMASGTTGRFDLTAGYCLGATLDRNVTTKAAGGTIVQVGQYLPQVLSVTGQSNGWTNFAQAPLPAGQVTACVLARRVAGGSATDVAGSFYVHVDDIGPAS